jgi:DNA-binding TFAR19-related protein (PDSD5 family)
MLWVIDYKESLKIIKLNKEWRDKNLTNNNSPNNKKNSTFFSYHRQVEEYRQGILAQILSPEAKDRRTFSISQSSKSSWSNRKKQPAFKTH